MILTVKLDPDGTLEMLDSRGRQHPFRRVGPDHWEAPISPYSRGSVRRDGNQLVFRSEPSGKQPQPIKGKNGLMFSRQVKSVEDRMTRVPEAATQPAAPTTGQ